MNQESEFQMVLKKFIKQRASDLYFLPFGDRYRLVVAFGDCKEIIHSYSSDFIKTMITYLKFQADMSVSDHRRPQSGVLQMIVENKKLNLRLSCVGNYNNRESLVVRIIYGVNSSFNLMDKGQWVTLSQMVKKRGMVIFAGPTGSGKTTTMYRLLKKMSDKVVITIEDPVEIKEEKFLQLQVNESAGMDYQELVKVALRHRPDILIIGEIRDSKTARMAVQAALSGHLVLTTVHAKSRFGVINRLLELGISNQYLSQVLTGIVYQRLVPGKEQQMLAIFDTLMDEEFDLNRQHSDRGTSNDWKKVLQTAVKNKTISQKVAENYWNG